MQSNTESEISHSTSAKIPLCLKYSWLKYAWFGCWKQQVWSPAMTVIKEVLRCSWVTFEVELEKLVDSQACIQAHMSHIMRKPVFGGCNQVWLKLACSGTETGKSLDILDLASTATILSKQQRTNTLIRLHAYMQADLRFCCSHKT